MAKKKAKRTGKTERIECSMDGCPNTAEPDDDLCAFHGTLADLTGDALDAAKKAFQKGNWANGLFAGLAGLALKQEPLVKNILGSAAQQFNRVTTPGPPPPPPQKDPWDILGLDKGNATEEDVRHVIKLLAQLYHPDKGNKAINTAKMAEFNAAAEACLQQLRASNA